MPWFNDKGKVYFKQALNLSEQIYVRENEISLLGGSMVKTMKPPVLTTSLCISWFERIKWGDVKMLPLSCRSLLLLHT